MTVGLALLLDLTSRLPRAGASAAAAHSHAGLSAAAVAATAAAAFSSSGVPLSARHLFGFVSPLLLLPLTSLFVLGRLVLFPGLTIAHCDAGTTAGWNDAAEIVNSLNTKIRDSFEQARTDYYQYPTKQYPSELKPLFSAFGLKNFTITTVRSFLLYYLPLLQPKPHPDTDDEDDDLLQEAPEEKPKDWVTPFQNSVKQIMRETSIVTTRRVLERIAVRHVSQRTAWKLLKDASKSAKRKAARGMSTPQYTFCVAKTTFRGCALGDVAGPVIAIIVFEKMQLPL
ncbi:hypothetical protein BAE44_0001151 [Dichanthelium oligosanthes]|uniref:Uncharacterized protein n=1 Tax=Dichanthelium oligosanthes TaxID=888268 RepID=A0A1E5WL30_9POAL|nr:hypothetical protein BAE44_0001151 [Dichanthelium oligosanthes]